MRTGVSSRLRSLAALSLVACWMPLQAAAQAVGIDTAPRGWVGISYSLDFGSDGRQRVIVTEVRDGSPAEVAGIDVGDELLSLNGVGAATNFGNLPLRIRPGDAIDVVLSRDGRPVRTRVIASTRPSSFEQQVSVTLRVTEDSVVESMFQAMDSLRLVLVTSDAAPAPGSEPRVGVVETGPDAVSVLRLQTAGPRGAGGTRVVVEHGEEHGGDVVTVTESGVLREVRAPFGFWVFTDPSADSLGYAMERLNREIRELRTREAGHLRVLEAQGGPPAPEPTDEALARLREIIKAYSDRSEALREAMARAVRDAAEPRADVFSIPTEGDDPAVREPGGERLFGPLTPYALGQTRVAGAEVADLRPELGRYFQVSGGVLVVDVVPGTPAMVAGIRGGDVITHVDRVSIRSTEELRTALSRAGPTLPVTVIRRGEAVQLLLRR